MKAIDHRGSVADSAWVARATWHFQQILRRKQMKMTMTVRATALALMVGLVGGLGTVQAEGEQIAKYSGAIKYRPLLSVMPKTVPIDSNTYAGCKASMASALSSYPNAWIYIDCEAVYNGI